MRNIVKKIAGVAFTATGILASQMASAAPVANGGFESGLSGWFSWGFTSRIGATALATGDTPYAPIEGSASALVVAMSAARLNEYWTCDNDRWNVSCPPPIEFAPSTAPRPSHEQWLNTEGVGYQMPYLPVWPYFRNGAYVARDIDVLAGDTLTWAWTAFGEVSDGSFGDRAFLIATNGIQAQIVRYTQGKANSISFDQGGIWSVFIGVGQFEDNQVWGAIEVDSIELRSVPEPTSIALALGATVALAVTRRSSMNSSPRLKRTRRRPSLSRLLAAISVAAASFVSTSVTAAPVVNGDFEDGLTGWYSKRIYYEHGTTAITRKDSAYRPLSGDGSAFIVAMSGWPLNDEVTCARDPWNDACPLPLDFATSDPTPPSRVRWLNGIVSPFIDPYTYAEAYFHNGSYIARDLQVSAGDTLTWEWSRYGELAIGEIGSGVWIDNAWFIATNGTAVKLISIRSGTSPSLTFDEGGLWSIYFGVQQTEDDEVWSALNVDSVQLNSVPEPDSLALGLGAIFTLALVRRKTLRSHSDSTRI